MRPPSKHSTSGRLAKALDAKVLSLVRQFVSEQSSDDPTLSLKLSAISAYVASDPSLTRHKKQTLEKSIERALDVIREEEDEEDELDSEFEGLEVGNLMVPDEKQANAVNKRITDMWGLNSGASSDAGKASTPQTPKADLPPPQPVPVVEPIGTPGAVSVPQPPGSPKRKRKDRGDEGKAKRQKGTTLGVERVCDG
jgi:ribosome biogenesis ATPase